MKPILVTGGAGYIGSHTVKELVKQGYKVIVFDNLSSGHKWAVDKKAKLIIGDLSDQEKIKQIFIRNKIDSVIHFAASIEAGESMERPGDFFRNNVTNMLNLLEIIKDFGVKKIIFSSSAAVYGEPKTVPIKEDATLAPINAYGSTKMIGEEMLKYFDIAHGIKSISLRYFNAAGADIEGMLGDEHRSKTHLITRVLMTARGKQPYFEVYGTDYKTKDGSCVRDYIHVTDLALAHIKALKYLYKFKKSNIFNLGTSKGRSNLEIIKKAKEISGINFKVKFSKRREGDPAKLIASNQKAKKLLGWEPKYSDLNTILKTAWNWEQYKK